MLYKGFELRKNKNKNFYVSLLESMSLSTSNRGKIAYIWISPNHAKAKPTLGPLVGGGGMKIKMKKLLMV